jgi:hypothetical protein
MLGIWQVYTRWLVLWRWTWPHAARASSNHITGPCHHCNSFRFTTFAHFTFAHVSVHCPFRHKERRETPLFARTTHKSFRLGQYRWPSLLGCHTDSAEQYARCVNSEEYALISNSELRHRTHDRTTAITMAQNIRSYYSAFQQTWPSKETTENEKSMNQSESNSNDASISARAKLLTNWSNNEPNNLFNSETFKKI